MAEPSVSFRITVEGGRESSQEVERVRQALSGVQTDLDGAGAASRIFGIAQSEVSQAMKSTVVEMSAFGGYTLQGADAAKKGAEGMGILGGATRSAHRELFEGAKLSRTFATALLGDLIPGLGAVTGQLTQLGRETTQFTLGQTLLTGGALAAALAIGTYAAKLRDVASAQIDANAAVKAFDFSKTESDLTKALGALDKYETTLDLAANTSVSFNTRSSVAFDAIKGSLENLPEKVVIAAEAWDKLWRATGQAADQSKAAVAAIDAQTAALQNLKTAAATPGDLLTIAAQEAELDRQRAAYAADDIARTRQATQQKLDAAVRVAVAENNLTLALRLQADADQYRATTAQLAAAAREQGEQKAAAAIRDGTIAASQATAAQAEAVARLAQIHGEAAQASITAAAAEVNARLAVAQADANYYGGAIANLTSYQAARKAAIVAGANEELATMTRVFEIERQAQQERIAGLEGQPIAQRAAYDQLEQMDAAYHANRQKLLDDLRIKLIQHDGQVEQEHRANVDRMKALDQARFDALKALGATTVADEVARQAALTNALRAGSQQRYAAEADLANRIKALWDSTVGAGKTAWDLAAQSLRESFGILDPTRFEIAAEWERIQQRAQQTADEIAAGARVSGEMKSQVEQVANAIDALTRSGTTFGQATGAYVEDLRRKLSGIPETADQTADRLDQLGVRIGTTMQTLAQSLVGVGSAIHDGMSQGLQSASGEVDRFLADVQGKLRSASGPMAESIAQSVIDRLRAMLDAEANRN